MTTEQGYCRSSPSTARRPRLAAEYLDEVRDLSDQVRQAREALIEACRNRPAGVTRQNVADELGISLRTLSYRLAGGR